eukprot:7715357-Pyramimonas_sp.AAC.1
MQAGKVAQRARRRAVQASLRSFQDWIVQESSMGAVHRCLRSAPYAADEYVDQVFNIVREAAKVQQFVPLEPQQIRKAASRMKAKA